MAVVKSNTHGRELVTRLLSPMQERKLFSRRKSPLHRAAPKRTETHRNKGKQMPNCGCKDVQDGKNIAERQFDARGIYLCATCNKCHARKMKGFRSEVLTNPQYEHNEQIEED